MAYNSYFDQLATREQVEPLERTVKTTIDLSFVSSALLHYCPKDNGFEGIRIYQMLDELANLVEKHDSIEDLAKLIWYPAKIICAATDHKILFKEEGQYVREATELALKVYKREATEEEILALRERFLTEEFNKVGFSSINIYGEKIKGDQRTCSAMNPEYSKKAVESLVETINSDDILFIALGNGGIAPGLDTFLRYCDQTQTDSSFYPVRFSMRKRGDVIPQLSPWEAQYIKEKRGDRKLVIFDEDRSAGHTLRGTHKFFHRTFAPKKDIVLMTNEEGVLRIDDLW
jgi:hypothetical protein